jgi:sialic acid synthase SpsE
MEIKIGSRTIGDQYPTYFIADIAANHDGDLERAKLLIRLAKEAGADAAKFQNFKAAKIVSDYGFKHMNGQMSHQESWKKSVFEVYDDASVPMDWTPVIKDYCDEIGIEYFTAPYDFDSIDEVDPYVPAYKVGSGDVNWFESLERMAKKGKPVLLATGASEIGEVQSAVKFIQKINDQLVLMQCNTNYTASLENFEHIHLNVLKTYATMFPDVVLGLSDHTPGHATVLGAVALGARVVEKHFTDDNNRVGPDHKFAMNPQSWADMVDNTRRLELALGSTQKFVAGNEVDTVVVQRRCVRAHVDLKAGDVITREMLDVLRPATKGAIRPDEIESLLGTRVLQDMPAGKEIRWTDVGA